MINQDFPEAPKFVDQVPASNSDMRYWEHWSETNKEAIAEYNERIAHEGLPLEIFRTF